MAKRLIFRESLAEVDLLDHLDYIADDNPDAALRFVEAVEKACERLAEMPNIGRVRQFNNPRLTGIRMWPVPGFSRHLIFYQVNEDQIRVLRILHSARDIPTLFE
jgi:toxin ParE1/3/4